MGIDDSFVPPEGTAHTSELVETMEKAFPAEPMSQDEATFKKKMAARGELIAHGATEERAAILALLRSKIKASSFNRFTEADHAKNETLNELIREIEARGK